MTSDKMNECNVLKEYEKGSEHDKDIDQPNIRHVIIDFGKCPVFGQYIENFPHEKLQYSKRICYKIMREQDISPIYSVFNFNKYEGVIKPEECLKLKIIYNPTIPDIKNVENFEFVDSSFNIIKIKIIGDCIGPILKASVKQLDFFITSCEKSNRRTVELENVSDVHAQFSFDYEKENSIFKVDPCEGGIKGRSHIYINITFKPKKYGFYSEYLYCLVWGGKPLLMQLHGIYNVSCLKIDTSNFQTYPFPFKNTFGYAAYFQDCSNVNISMPPVSISRNYIDFGRVLKSDDATSCIEFITVKNNLENNIIVKWPNDEIFEIIPKRAEILPSMKASFRCNFYPNNKNKLYSKIFNAQIKWMPKFVHGLVLPIAASIKLQGHSFPNNEYWISKVEISPQVITLPACVSGDPSYATFKITILGHLPVMYKLIPPKTTNLIMKPMVGIVRSYQIVVIQFYWKGTEKFKNIEEMWHIELNNRKEKQIPICIRGEVSVPKIVVGENNVVKFKSNAPGCKSIEIVPLKNTSCCQIRYEFQNKKYEFIDIIPKADIVSPNDIIYIKFSYIGSLEHPKELKLKCKLQRMKTTMEFVGASYLHTFTVFTNCQYKELCCTPTYHMFGEIQLDSFLETEFYIFNFGNWDVSFSLKIIYGTDNLDYFKLNPSVGEIEPGGKIKICVTGSAKTLGNRTIIVTYSNIIENHLEQFDQEENKKLFEMHYVGELPVLQIKSIIEHNFGPLFSKEHLWNYLNIEQLNIDLRTMLKEERRTHCMYLPQVQVNDETYFLTLEMENKSMYEVDVSLERKQLCECSLKEVAVNINTTKLEFDCPHREMLCMQLTETKFYKHAQQQFNITIRYLLPGETKMCYILQLPHSRCIEIFCLIYSIPINSFKMSCYTNQFHMDLQNISVCRKVPPIQICWFYNNTDQSATYKLNITDIIYLCQREGYEVLKCINPKGTIDPYSTLPLMIKFQPIEIKEYVVNTSLTCDDQVYDFCIKGSGQRDINICTYENQITNLGKQYYKFPAVLSPDYIPINSILTWSTTERVVFITNTSKDTILHYFWEDFFFRVGINNIVELNATNKLGILQPQESQATVIKIKTFNEACDTSLQLSCHFLDYNELILYQKSLEETVMRQVQDKGNILEYVYEENTEIEHPKPFSKTIIINLQIIHIQDSENFFTMKQQFQSNPNDYIGINISNVLSSLTTWKAKEDGEKIIENQDKITIQLILKQLIADFAFSNYLQEVLDYSNKLPLPLYKQFTLDERQIIEKKKTNMPLSNDDLKKFKLEKIEMLFIRPKPSLVNQVTKDLIINGIHDIFKLGIFKPIEKGVTEKKKSDHLKNCKCKKTNHKM